jgi:NAD(P) transhydrogenase subunit alpha
VPLRVAVPTETAEGETRVALTPDGVRRLSSDTVECAVQAGAGESAAFTDADYEEQGAHIVGDAAQLLGEADVVLKVNPPDALADGRHEADLIREGAVLISLMRPHQNADLIQRLAGRKVTALALELLPRTTRAQAMDVLSSQATLAGYKAAVIGADSLGRIFPLLMTAAGTLSPAKVLILGAGVAGLQAIATARRLGGAVEGYDIRAAVKEEVESLGAKFVEWGEDETAGAEAERETEGGYAKQLAEDEQARERELVALHVAKSDVVITTALVPGKPAPLLITEEMVQAMSPGSVIVDLAGEAGGNCALSEAGQTVKRHGVTIHAPLNLPATLPTHASQMFGRNVSALLKEMVTDDGLSVDFENDILDACCVTHDGQVRFEG